MADNDDGAIVVKRPSAWGMFLRSVIIYIDGKRVGKVGNGQSVIFDVVPGSHAVHIRLDWMKTTPVAVDVGPGETVILECQTGARLVAAGLGGVESRISIRRIE